MEINLSTLAKHFSDEEAAWELVEHLRWPAGPVCPHCGDTGRAYFLKPRTGTRTTSTGRVSYRRRCRAACRTPITAGTLEPLLLRRLLLAVLDGLGVDLQKRL
jgi:hypothetical protein